jgi:glycosyltransferase involved in cell wall biosynthesis
MRTIQVVNVRWFNATSWYGLFLSKLLQEQGHDVLVLTLESTETHAKALSMGLETMCLPLNSASPTKLLESFRQINSLIRSFRPDIVNCHRGESFILWGLLRRLQPSFRLVRTRGDQRLPKANPANKVLHRSMADAVIATNSAMAAHVVSRLGVPQDKVHVILGGVDRNRFRFDSSGRERVRREFGYGRAERVVGILGRFDRVKGHLELFKAMARVHERDKGARLLLIGFDTTIGSAQIMRMAREQGIEGITRITGLRDDVPACISALDLGVIASLGSETIARAALEIMSCGVPLVGTDVGVMPDLLSAQRTAPPGDVNRMAELISSHLAEPQRLEAVNEQKQTISGLSGQDFLRKTLRVYGAH